MHEKADVYLFWLTVSAQGLENNLSDKGFESNYRGISQGFKAISSSL